MPTPEKIQCAHCGKVRNTRKPCCPNERVRRGRVKRGYPLAEKTLDDIIIAAKSTIEKCSFCGGVRNKAFSCCKHERYRRVAMRKKNELEPDHHRCVDCGKISETYRCKACTIRHRKKNGMPVRGGVDWLE